MPINPRTVLKQVALRTLHLSGTSQGDLESAYDGLTLDGADVPLSAFVDAAVASEAKIAHIIANDKLHPYRIDLYGRSDTLAPGDEVPSFTDEAVPFIGVFSQISDATTSMALTEAPIQQVRRFMRGNYTTAIHNYSIQGTRVYHTRDNVIFEGCAWSRDLAAARFAEDADDDSPLPAAVEQLWVADVLAHLAQEGWFTAESSHYQGLAATGFAQLANRIAPAIIDAQSTNDPRLG
jgi:hypothetical protein